MGGEEVPDGPRYTGPGQRVRKRGSNETIGVGSEKDKEVVRFEKEWIPKTCATRETDLVEGEVRRVPTRNIEDSKLN